MNKNTHGKKSRQRGIKASRIKLESALCSAGLKTQAALAEKIADREELDSAPKDLVSKAFRELLIEPQSLERIASALNVEAYTLYLNSADINHAANTEESVISSPKMKTKVKVRWFAFFMALLIVVIAAWRVWFIEKQVVVETALPSFVSSALIYPTDASLYPVAEQINKKLSEKFKATVLPMALNKYQNSSSDLLREFQSDWLVILESVNVGRYLGLRVYLSNGTLTELVLVVNASQAELLKQSMSKRVAQNELLNNILDITNAKSPLPKKTLMSKLQQSDFLMSKQLIEDYQSFDNLNKAQLITEQLIRDLPQFAPAYALLCEITLYESWRGNEKSLLDEAKTLCLKASELSPDDIYVQGVLGTLYAKSGELSLAKKQFWDILTLSPSYIEALMGLASVYFEQYRNEAKNELLVQALEYARQATLKQPSYWRPFQLLAIIEFSGGNIENAIAAWESLIELQPNELILTNLGLMYTCRAQFELAKERFVLASSLAPNSYIPLEGLATINYYLGNFEQALELRLKVKDLIGNEDSGIHQQWGDLGDTYRHLNNNEDARLSYQKALIILERDTLHGNSSTDNHVYRNYYQARLLSSSQNKISIINELNSIKSIGLSAPAKMKMAQTYLALGFQEKAKQLIEMAAQSCSVYYDSPDFNVFSQH